MLTRKEIAVAVAACLGVAILAAFFASPSPDGLEAVAERLAFAVRAKEAGPAPMPGYVIPRIASPAAATVLAGAAGIAASFVLAGAAGMFLRRRKGRHPSLRSG